jgi:hypothetical protein
MRIRIQLLKQMQIRIQFWKWMRIHPDPDSKLKNINLLKDKKVIFNENKQHLTILYQYQLNCF